VIPEWRDTLRFRTEGGHLKNVLGKDVPVQAGQAIKKLAQRLLSENGLESANISHWMLHPGGEKVIREAEKALELNSEQTKASWEILRDHGNMSSSSVLFVLEKEMKIHPPRPGEWGFLCSFGAGFSVHAALLEF
jgi:alkylresorcinol/alkylpyrone synthase